MKKNVIKSFLFLSFFLTVSLANGETCSSVGVIQYKPSGSCDTQQRECCRNGSWSAWGGSCTGAANCTSSEVWNGKECINCSNATVKAANKAYCCPSAAQTDNVCYKDCYHWSGDSGTVVCYDGSYIPCGSSYNGYCTGQCSAYFSTLETGLYERCRNVSIGSECSLSDYNEYPGDKDGLGGVTGMGIPCLDYRILKYSAGYISEIQAYHLWCAKSSTRCKNGW